MGLDDTIRHLIRESENRLNTLWDKLDSVIFAKEQDLTLQLAEALANGQDIVGIDAPLILSITSDLRKEIEHVEAKLTHLKALQVRLDKDEQFRVVAEAKYAGLREFTMFVMKNESSTG